jgi:hypothetical protein
MLPPAATLHREHEHREGYARHHSRFRNGRDRAVIEEDFCRQPASRSGPLMQELDKHWLPGGFLSSKEVSTSAAES